MLVQRKSPKKHTPGGAVSGHPAIAPCIALPPASMPSPTLRVRERRPGSADRPSLACSGIGALHRADPAGLFVRHSPRHRGPRLGGILPQKQQHEQLLTHLVCRRQRSSCRSAGMHGFVDQRAVRGGEHRRRCGSGPQGRGDGSPRLRSSTRTYCLRNPATPRSAGQFDSHATAWMPEVEQRRSSCRMRIEPPRWALAFLVTFWGTAPQERREQRSWPRSGGGQDARSHAKK